METIDMYNKNKTNTMNKEFLKMQKIAGLITENQVNEMMSDEREDTPHQDGDFDPAKAYADDNSDDKFTIIDGIIGRDLYDNFINAVEAIQDATIGQAGIEPRDVYDYLTNSMLRDA
jgi:hypothetical protein